jgi:LmbE family N-acetylglucosaminyl deacetylase
MKTFNEKNILVFAPHPDDETLGCGGTIARLVKEGCDVKIFFMTDGRYALSKLLGIFSDPSPSELVEIRRRESIRATGILGLRKEDLLFLGIEDRCLEKEKAYVQERLKELLKGRLFREIYFPSDKDIHPDHQATSSIVRNLIRDLGIHSKNYNYIIRTNYGRIGVWMQMALSIYKRNLVHSDISEFLNLKMKALDEYKSQISIISEKQKGPVLDTAFLKKFLKNEETFFVE